MRSWLTAWPEEYHGLLSKVVDTLNLNSFHLNAEISGKSGARTFRVNADASGGIANPVVIKIGSAKQIEDEINRMDAAANHFNAIPVKRLTIEYGDLACVVMSLALEGKGESLRACYSRLEPERVESVIRHVFEANIRIREKTQIKNSANVFAFYDEWTDGFVRELRAAGDHPCTLWDWWQHAKNTTDYASSLISFIHGDLHGDNILIDLPAAGDDRNVNLLDFGLSDERGHAYRDLAKLEREIWLFVDEVTPTTVGDRCDTIAVALSPNAKPVVDEPLERAVKGIKAIRQVAKNFLYSAHGDIEIGKYEHTAALMAQFMFAAAAPSNDIAIRQAALIRARALRHELETLEPRLRLTDEERRIRELEEVAWRFAYSFLRLDQLPKGAWARTLAMWMESLWEGEHGTIFRSPEMTHNGGVDSTGYATSILFDFWASLFQRPGIEYEHSAATKEQFQRLLTNNQVIATCAQNLEQRIANSGGIDVHVPARGGFPPVKVRHSLIALLTLLRCDAIQAGLYVQHITDLVNYLLENLKSWREDESHLFAMYASGVALWSTLSNIPQDSHSALQPQLTTLRTNLDRVLKKMAESIADERWYKPAPDGTYSKPHQDRILVTFFKPYCQFWRMERSNALMFLPFLISEDRSTFLREHELDLAVMARLRGGLIELLDEVKDTNNPETGLVRYHQSPENVPAPRDWGLSAELLALLEMPVISNLILKDGRNERSLKEKKRILQRSLIDTLAEYPTYRGVFKFTHGLSAGAFLRSGLEARICPEHVAKLDERIDNALKGKSTERELYRLAAAIYGCYPEQRGDIEIPENRDQSAKELTELFVSKLASGEHSADLWTDDLRRKTIEFFDSDRVRPYIVRYGIDEAHNTLVTRIKDVAGSFPSGDKVALDLGCGAGQCSNWMIEQGFYVHLVDASNKMLDLARKNTSNAEERCEFHNLDVLDIERAQFAPNSFNLVVANALLVHIPPQKAGHLLAQVWRLLKPGGIFFVNFKLRDNTLISLDNRYFVYYRDLSLPETMLRNAGFVIDEIAQRWNDRTLYNVPKSIQWANFYCHRPINGSKAQDYPL